MTVQDLRARILEELSWDGPLSVSEIAAMIGVSTTRVRSVVATLHKEGLVEHFNNTNAIQITKG